MASNCDRGQEAEKMAQAYMQQRFLCTFEPKSLPVGTTSEGNIAKHNFDLVSSDCRIVAEVKAHRMTESGNTPSGKIDNAYHACLMLEKVSAEKKLLLLTDLDFYLKFKKYSDGKIDNKIIIQLVPHIETNVAHSKTTKQPIFSGTPTIPQEMSFDVFWTELKSFLSSRRMIRNWTIQKGYFGEDFEAIHDFGKVVVYPKSASRQEVPRADFKLVFDNWQRYIKGTVTRGPLSEISRFTKYTISIIHEYLINRK